jgi:hypothetical protein
VLLQLLPLIVAELIAVIPICNFLVEFLLMVGFILGVIDVQVNNHLYPNSFQQLLQRFGLSATLLLFLVYLDLLQVWEDLVVSEHL